MGVVDDDTLFFFNYRSDRMREIASVFGLPDKPMEVEVPKNLVRLPHITVCSGIMSLTLSGAAYHHHVALQRRVPLPCRLPSPGHDQRPRRVARQEGREAGSHRRYVLSLSHFHPPNPPSSSPSSAHPLSLTSHLSHIQRPRNTPTSLSSSTAVSKNSSRTKSAT